MSESKVGLYAAIRRDHDRNGLSQRALQRKYNVTWRTVRRALDGQWPEPRKKPRPRESRLDPYKQLIDEMLRADLDAPAKQRHTAQSIFDRLVDEHDARNISYPDGPRACEGPSAGNSPTGRTGAAGDVRAADPSARGPGGGRLRRVPHCARREDDEGSTSGLSGRRCRSGS